MGQKSRILKLLFTIQIQFPPFITNLLLITTVIQHGFQKVLSSEWMLRAADTMEHRRVFFLILLSRGHDEVPGRKGQLVFALQQDMGGQKGLVISVAVPMPRLCSGNHSIPHGSLLDFSHIYA